MLIDLGKPVKIGIEKFSFDCRKEDLNPFAIKKLLKNKYDAQGKVLLGENFEEAMLLEFIKKYRCLDRYTKVKIGEYTPQKKVLEYKAQVLEALKIEDIEKLLFLCRICSYIGDPSFPDFILNVKSQGLRFVYTGDELIPEKLVFLFLGNILGVHEIKLATLDFTDFKYPESLQVDMGKTLETALEALSKRANIENSLVETGIDFKFFKKWAETKSIDTEEVFFAYKKFAESASKNDSLKGMLERMESVDIGKHFIGRPKQEKLKVLRDAFGINMLIADDLLNVYEILSQK